MNGLASLALACAAFAGTHYLLSHPFRASLVARMGEGPFRGLYSLISLVTLGWMIWTYRAMGAQQPIWLPGNTGLLVATALMWLAAIFLVGSFIGNPALPGGGRPKGAPTGVLAITRHPMMWSFAIWAIVHAYVVATPKALLFDATILVVALVGSVLQDRKKRALMGQTWHDWTTQTAFWPFTRGFAYPGTFALIGGTVLLLVATWFHPYPVGPWMFVG